MLKRYFHEEFDSLKLDGLFKQKAGGHVMEFKGKNFKVGMDKLTSYRFVLPQTPDYDTVNLKKNFNNGKKSGCGSYFSTRSLSALVYLSFIVKIF